MLKEYIKVYFVVNSLNKNSDSLFPLNPKTPVLISSIHCSNQRLLFKNKDERYMNWTTKDFLKTNTAIKRSSSIRTDKHNNKYRVFLL